MRYWYEQGGQTKGPVEEDELRSLVQQGVLGNSSRIIEEGGAQWSTVGERSTALGLGAAGGDPGSTPSYGGATSYGGAGAPSSAGAGYTPSYAGGSQPYGDQSQGGQPYGEQSQGGTPQPQGGGYQPQYGGQQPPYGGQATGTSDKDWTTALLLSIFLGGFGGDRFYLGYTGLGVAKLLTLGGCGVWSIIDIINIATNKMTDSEGRPLSKK